MNDAVFIIAEAGVNHNGSLDLALQLVDAAAAAGADAVKFQTFKSANLVTSTAPKARYQLETTSTSESQLDMLRRLELRSEHHQPLIERCLQLGIEFISTPFDLESLRFLVELGVGRLKIPSGELTNAPLILDAGRSGKPVILSTGMASLEEVRTALSILAFGYLANSAEPSIGAFAQTLSSPDAAKILSEKVTLLHCTTQYPAPFEDSNLRAMDTLRDTFGVPVGLSDHTPGIAAAAAAVARGAAIIEKHMTLDRSMEGPDHLASLEPSDFALLVTTSRQIILSLGSPEKNPTPSELRNLAIVRKSLVATSPIRPGDFFTPANITAKRPGTGLSPLHYWDIIGRKADRPYGIDEPIQLPTF